MLLSLLTTLIAPTTWTLVCGGDIMLNGVSPRVKTFANVRVPSSSLFYANLEIPLTDTRERTPRKTAEEIRARDQYVLKASPGHINNMKASGIDVVSLANNHAMDGGVSGLKQMLSLLGKSNLPYCGAGLNWGEAVKPAVLTTPSGIKVAFVSYLSFLNRGSLLKCMPATTTAPGIAALTLKGKSGPQELSLLQGIVAKAKAQAEIVVICLHWGVEKAPLPSQYQVDMARLFVDAGADVVVGAHPHVLQPAELYKGKPILYSLGNLVNPGAGNTALYSLNFEGSRITGATAGNWFYRNGKLFEAKQNPKGFVNAETALERRYQAKGLIKAFTKN